MRRRHRWLLAAGAAVALAGGAVLAAPRVLPEIPGFEVRRVEVLGASLLAADEVVRGAGITAGQSIWDDATAWVAALEGHAVVEEATIGRRLPGTLRIEVREKRPVALAADGVLVPVTVSGERLPVDPTRSAPDLPIARGEAGVDGIPPLLLAELDRLARVDPELMAEVSEVEARDEAGTTLLLRHREADIEIPAGASADRLMELRAVLADLDGRGDGKRQEAVRVDLRFADQIVVRMPSSVQKP